MKTNENTINSTRQIWPDILRIAACMMVVGIHTSGTYYYVYPGYSKEWWLCIIIDSFDSFAVANFFMISGMFMLEPSKDVTIKKIYMHHIPKMAGLVIYSILWECIVGLLNFFLCGTYEYTYGAPIHTLFWIVLMYIFTPAIRCATRERGGVLRYLIVVLVILTTIIAKLDFIPFMGYLSAPIKQGEYFFFSITFFTMGYFLNSIKIRIDTKWLVLGIGIAYSYKFYSMAHFLDQSLLLYKIMENAVVQIYVLIMACSTFLLYKNLFSNIRVNDKMQQFIRTISGLTMYVYVMHTGVIRLFKRYNFLGDHFLQVPLQIAINIIISMIISYAFTRIIKSLKSLYCVLRNRNSYSSESKHGGQ